AHVSRFCRRPTLPTPSDEKRMRQSGPSLEALRVMIEDLIASGEPLPPERRLVEEFGAPRSRLRKVLADMRAAGDLPPAQVGRRSTRESGPQVNDFARITNPTDIIELRLILEPQLARLAAIRASSLQTVRVIKAATSAPDQSYGGADIAFHLEVAAASRNALGRELYALLRKVGADSRVRLTARCAPTKERRVIRDAEHMRIAKAIAARDPERAEEAMRQHLANVQALILERLSPDHADGTNIAILGAAE
ncbi:MAG: FCD domain-containing protein, partial [Pseudomonadota bacterium]